jgi:hypothetical protein
MFSVKINGFRSKAEAEAFVEWYEGQGEQDAQLWLEESKARGRIDRDFFPVDMTRPPVFEENMLVIWIN